MAMVRVWFHEGDPLVWSLEPAKGSHGAEVDESLLADYRRVKAEWDAIQGRLYDEAEKLGLA